MTARRKLLDALSECIRADAKAESHREEALVHWANVARLAREVEETAESEASKLDDIDESEDAA